MWDEFEKSVAMSTYLVAFAIMDFPSIVVSGQDGSSTLIRGIYSTVLECYTITVSYHTLFYPLPDRIISSFTPEILYYVHSPIQYRINEKDFLAVTDGPDQKANLEL